MIYVHHIQRNKLNYKKTRKMNNLKQFQTKIEVRLN